MRSDLDPMLTPAEVADLFQVSRQTIWRWRKEGRLEGVTVARTVRFRRADVEALLRGDEPERAA